MSGKGTPTAPSSRLWWTTFGVLCVATFLTRFCNVLEPDHVCWDETHFGKMASWYINRTFFFDVHPPLGKMLIALSGKLTGYDGTFPFDKPGDKYEGARYEGMRIFCTTLGALVIPLTFLTLWEMTKSLDSTIMGTVLLLCDVGFLTLNRYILLDPILLFFMSCSMYGAMKVRSLTVEGHPPFSPSMLGWQVFLGAALACTMSVKFVGLFVVLFVGLRTIADLWNVLGDLTKPVVINDNYFGMGKEVENLILENNELLATKNALNVVKDDLIVKLDELTGEHEILREEVANLSATREKLRERVTQLEEEMRHLKETVSSNAGGENEDEADVPMSQRRRFTRVEMARVLMERNQYKERFMELQDAVRWTEMVRASRNDSTMDKKSKQSIWKFFSNLFSTSDRPQRPLSTPHLRPVTAPQSGLRHSRTQADFLQTQLTDHHRRQERTDQVRQVLVHVRKEDGRTQAYGWSLPGKTGQGQKGPSPCTSLSSGGVPVPVPVFCRPIAENEPRMTLLCAAAVNLTGGRTPDGGCMVGESVFYAKDESRDNVMCLAEEMSKLQHSPEVEDVNRQLQSTQGSEQPDQSHSSLVWICSFTQDKGIVMIIDANNPAEVIESFSLEDKHILCIAAVPGAVEDDYREYEERMAAEPPSSFPKADSMDSQSNGPVGEDGEKEVIVGTTKLVQATLLTPPSTPVREPEPEPATAPREATARDPAPGSPPLGSTPDEHLGSPEPGLDAFAEEQSNADSRADVGSRRMSTVTATMWLGTKSGRLHVHSAVARHGECLARVKLNDAILSIVACASRCVVALADGSAAVFLRLADGQWDFTRYWQLALGDPKCSVRCLSAVGNTVWCGYRNRVHVVEPRSLTVLHSLEAHPRQESQVRQMAGDGDGVWVSIKMDSTLRLYHAHTYQHLKDVDIEPYVSKMLGTGKLGFSLVRITALLISTGRLWIGTSNGVVISVPLSEGSGRDSGSQPARGSRARSASPTGSIPWCSMAHAQLSFHGHRDAVTFFVAAGSGRAAPRLVLSGGEGYIDFRIADSEMEDSVAAGEDSNALGQAERASRSHLIVWQVASA